MNSDSDYLPIDPESDDVVTVDMDVDAQDLQDAAGMARIWVYVVPVAVVHLALIYALARSAFDFKIPAYLHVEGIVAWLWVNGAAIGLAVWFWKRGRVPIAAGKWLHGRRARWLILVWLGSSLAWFLIPAVLRDAWDMLLTRLTSW